MTRVTQEQVAKAAGVNKATVSRALCGDPRITAATANKIRKVAKQLGYRPDPALAAVAAARWRGGDGRTGVTLAYISQLHRTRAGLDYLNRQGAQERAEELGWHLDHFILEDYTNASTLERILVSRGIRGLIVAPFFQPQPALTLNWKRFCAVTCGISPLQPPLHVVEHDAFDGALLAWKRALEYGYRRPGFALLRHAPPAQVEDDDAREAAALFCQTKLPPGDRVPPVFYSGHSSFEESVAHVLAWYRRWKPDVVLGFNNTILDMFLKMAGMRVPGDIAFISLVVSESGRAAGVKDPAVEIGRSAMDLLQLTLRTNQWGLPATRIRHYLEPQWMDGPTLPRLTPSPAPPLRAHPRGRSR